MHPGAGASHDLNVSGKNEPPLMKAGYGPGQYGQISCMWCSSMLLRGTSAVIVIILQCF